MKQMVVALVWDPEQIVYEAILYLVQQSVPENAEYETTLAVYSAIFPDK